MFGIRDRTRDQVCTSLQNMGINAQMAERGRAEENIERKFVYKSLGLIDIPEGPISWVNFVKDRELFSFLAAESGIIYFSKYGVPDTRLGLNSPKVKIKSFRQRESPLVGKVVDLYWKGKDFGLGIIDRLNSDTSTRRPMNMDRDVTIRAYGKHGLWIISFEASRRCEPPSKDMWNWFQAIAKNLLLGCAGLGLTPEPTPTLTPTPAPEPKPEPASEAPEVTFPDKKLEAAIRDALGKPVGEKIIAADPAGLTILVADNKGISDLSGLEHCTSLTTLKLWENQISDISPLSNLTSLTSLTLDVNQISDIAPLANHTSLTSLLLSENHISDISPLANLTSLTLLSLSANQISDISPLVENSGLGAGDEVWLLDNNLDLGEGSEDMENIRALEDRGVVVHY